MTKQEQIKQSSEESEEDSDKDKNNNRKQSIKKKRRQSKRGCLGRERQREFLSRGVPDLALPRVESSVWRLTVCPDIGIAKCGA